jgi:hypothetical protein
MLIKNIFSSIFKEKRSLDSSSNATADLIAKVEASEYFDADWYVQTNSDVDFSNVFPIEHFLERGHLESRNPSPKFELSAYLNLNPDVAASKFNPLVHYIQYGKKEGRKIQPDLLPEPEQISVPVPITMQQQLESTVLSDEQTKVFKQLESQTDFQGFWYAAIYSELDIDEHVALKHYVLFGADQNRDPTPFFSTSAYKKQQSHLLGEGVNPFQHFHTVGCKASVRPVRSAHSSEQNINNLLASYVLSAGQKNQVSVFAGSQWFDSKWYVEALDDEEVDILFAIKHYILLGATQEKDPCPLFSTKYYLQTYLDVATSGLNPLFHYISFGMSEKREIKESIYASDISLEQVVDRYELTANETKDVKLIQKSKWFSKNWYVDTYPELNISANKAAKHYYLFGTTEEKDPCPYFSTSFYLMCHADVAAIGINPLLHYVKYGQNEGRAVLVSKYGQLDLAGNIVEKFTNNLVSLDFSHLHHSSIESDEIPELSCADLQTINLGEINVGEVAGSLASSVQANIRLFESLCQTYAVEVEQIEAWESEANNNLAQFLRDICIVNNNSLRLRFELPNLVGKSLSVEAYQLDTYDQTIKLVATTNLNVTSLNFADLELTSQFQPVALMFKVDGQIVQSYLLPFPSLTRGGVHFAELCVQSSIGSDLNQRLIAYSRELLMDSTGSETDETEKKIKISLQNVIGNEALFDRNFMDWMKNYFNIRYTGYLAKPDTLVETQRQAYLSEIIDLSDDSASDIRINVIDRDSLPTLKLVTNIYKSNKTQGSSVIVPESMTVGAAKIVILESKDNNTFDISFSNDNSKYTSFPSSVVQRSRNRDDSIELISAARDQEVSVQLDNSSSMSIILIIKANNHAHQARLWETIRKQKGIDDVDVVLGLDNPVDSHVYLPNGFNGQYQVLKRLIDESHQVFYKRCVDAARHDVITHTIESAIYYDDRTLAQLGSMISNTIKCSSLKLLKKTSRGKGYQLSQVPNAMVLKRDGDSLGLDSQFQQSYYPSNQIYSVVANQPLVVTFEKQQMSEFLSNYCSDCEFNRLFIDFGVHLASRGFEVVYSNQMAIGVELITEPFDLDVVLTNETITILKGLKNQVEESRGCL